MVYYRGRKIDRNLCTKCQKEPRKDLGQRWCNKCHAEYMRKWRKTHKLTEEQKKKASCRSYSRVYCNRGKIAKTPCADCGSENNLQRHHEDYKKPLQVTWLCKKCHQVRTNKQRGAYGETKEKGITESQHKGATVI